METQIPEVTPPINYQTPPIIQPNNESVLPQSQTNTQSNSRTVLYILIIVILLLITGGIYAIILKNKKKPITSSNTFTPTISPKEINQNNLVPTIVTQTGTTAIFQNKGIQFSYDNSWKIISGDAIATGNFDDLSSDNSDFLFYSQDNWQTEEKAINNLKQQITDNKTTTPSSGDIISLFLGFAITARERANFIILPGVMNSAQINAQDATKGNCTGDNLSYDSSNKIDESRINTITINGIKGYVVLSQPSCSVKNITIFIDSNTNLPTPSPIPGVTNNLFESQTSYVLTFNKATDLQHLSQAQQIIFNSIRLY